MTVKPKPVVEPPEYAVYDADETLGGVITLCSPRRLITYGKVTFCEGREPGFLRRFGLNCT